MILIDSDSLVYACGFASQTSRSLLVVEDPDGKVSTDITTNMVDWKREHKGWTVLEREVQIEAEPESHAIQALRLALSTIIAKCGGGKHESFITGKTNFRDKIATIKIYKGNRDKLHKPVHYTALREYLLSEGAVLVEGQEADDEVSIRAGAAKRKPVIVASIDKDLDQIAGRHYNPQRDEHYAITKPEAQRWFLQQILTGDTVDNVGGCWRVGPAAAERILADVPANDPWGGIVKVYADSQAKEGCPYAQMTAEAAALENARLVFMLHKAEQAEEEHWWTPEEI